MEKEKTINVAIPFAEMRALYRKEPKPEYLYRGIQEKSVGLIFGPSKSGKTIFCENLLMSMSCGLPNYLDGDLAAEQKKTLMIGLEEFWIGKSSRNLKQYNSLSDEEQKLVDKNYLVQNISFTPSVTTSSQWNDLRELIITSKAEVVVVYSITRLNHGQLEDSSTAEKIMQRLRAIATEAQVTIICIHHTPKMLGRSITMDSIKGSSTFAQESDFAIGVNTTQKGNRYIKEVFYRYAPYTDEDVWEFTIEEDCWLNFETKTEEQEILNRSDRRKTDRLDKVIGFFEENKNHTYPKSKLIEIFSTDYGISKRSIGGYLSTLTSKGVISNPKHGFYTYVSAIDEKKL
jgi:archaellum biogenesis ATPase FlaH